MDCLEKWEPMRAFIVHSFRKKKPSLGCFYNESISHLFILVTYSIIVLYYGNSLLSIFTKLKIHDLFQSFQEFLPKAKARWFHMKTLILNFSWKITVPGTLGPCSYKAVPSYIQQVHPGHSAPVPIALPVLECQVSLVTGHVLLCCSDPHLHQKWK